MNKKKRYKSNVGVEVEVLLSYHDGFTANLADSVLNDSRNSGYLVKEGRKNMVEINSDPKSTIREIHQDLYEKLNGLEKICETYNVVPISASEFGAGKSIKRVNPRYSAYGENLGELSELLGPIAGIHIHIDQDKERKIEQFQLLTSLDSLSYGITSTSPISEKGKNGLNNQRVNIVRNIVYDKLPLHAKLQNYPSSINEIDERGKLRVEQWFEGSNMNREEFNEVYNTGNTGYHPVRNRQDIGPTGTWEVRSFDTAPLPYALAAIAIYKGANDRMLRQNIPTKIATEDNNYSFSASEIILPNHNTLLKMQEEAIKYGLKSQMLKKYLSHVKEFAQEGLSEEDRAYLKPIDELLSTGKNPASLIMDHMRFLGYKGEEFTPNQSAQANLFARKMYQEGLKYQPTVN